LTPPLRQPERVTREISIFDFLYRIVAEFFYVRLWPKAAVQIREVSAV